MITGINIKKCNWYRMIMYNYCILLLQTGILVVHIPWDIMSKDVYPYDSLNINISEYNEFYGRIYIYTWQLSTCAVDNGDSYES